MPSEDDELPTRRLAEQVLSLRQAAGLTQSELAKKAGTSRSVILRLETGVTLPTIATLKAIGDALGVELKVGYSSPAQAAPPESYADSALGPKVKIFVADSQQLLSESLATALARFPDFEVGYLMPIIVPATGVETADAVIETKPDVAVIDYWLAEMDGPVVTRTILSSAPDVKVLLSTWIHNPKHVQEALEAGAAGFLLKSLSVDQVAEAIRQAYAGQPLVYAEQLARHIEMVQDRQDRSEALISRMSTLTPKEIDVLRVLGSGRPAKEVAKSLQMAPSTLRKHIENIMAKTGAITRMEAVAMARRAKLIDS